MQVWTKSDSYVHSSTTVFTSTNFFGKYGFSVLPLSLQSLKTKAILQPAKAAAMCKVPHAETRPPPLFVTIMLLLKGVCFFLQS